MTHNIELGYLGLEVADVPAFETFMRDTVGLVPGDDPHHFRNDGKAWRIAVQEGPRNDAAYAGFEAVDDRAFAATVARLRANGFDVHAGTDDERKARAVDDLAWCVAPWGTRVEIVHGLRDAVAPFASELVPGGFLTEHEGFGHAVFAATDLAEAHRFATEGLGMEQSDWLEMDAGGFTLEVRFYHCNARHHSLALAGVPFDVPTKLHHVMVEANRVDDVGTAFDRAFASGLPIANGLGKHPNDEMFSFYVVTPAGFQLEFGTGARTISEPWTGNQMYDRISAWGHQPVTRP
jgi:2,3-dihydroxybiphenyl 1,2-dioxygenase